MDFMLSTEQECSLKYTSRGGWTRVIKCHQCITCTNKMAGINHALLCLAKDAAGNELGEP